MVRRENEVPPLFSLFRHRVCRLVPFHSGDNLLPRKGNKAVLGFTRDLGEG